MDAGTLTGLALALGCGLLIGVERERRKGSGAARQFAGVRTFTLVSLLGASTQILGLPWLTVLGGALVAGLAVVSHWRDRGADPGATTEVALFLTFVLGAMSIGQPQVAAASAVIVAALLASRTTLQRFSTQILSEREYRSALVLAAAALVVLPLMSSEPLHWLGGVVPYTVWRLVVLMMAIQAIGHVALRLFGPRFGLALSGLASGSVSSTATVAAMGAHARQHPALTMPCVCGALLSTVSTSVQIGLIAWVVDARFLAVLAPSLACALLASVVTATVAFRKDALSEAPLGDHEAFSIVQAVGMALMLSGVSAVVAWVQGHFGQTASLVTAIAAGFADAHAASAAVMSVALTDPAGEAGVRLAVLWVLTANNTSKLVLAFVAGGARYGWRTGAGLALVAGAAWLPVLLAL